MLRVKEKYGVVLYQPGGCDYTIGCGLKVVPLDAETEEEAIKEAKSVAVGIPDYEEQEEYDMHGYHGESKLSDALLISFVGYLPINEWYDEYEAEEKRLKDKEEEDKEKAELKRLKAKYG